ncbi:phage holin family protein [Bradymonas sediminis]|uniref:Uncharacterized protein n=1 Tax=Bradymonas sediminis TaxID=1548548 RepID=A0A2Z4FKU0_9DELT|nr:phage holin family protein [Bradymonas sediminis]AWV89450.1 hypothetical protein DN745_08905 [Bradymonas sediminis]TDP76824.1 putative membrane protein [Bradymonas sediminis]
MSFFLSWLVMALAVWLTATILPGVHVKNLPSTLIIAAIFGVLNFLLGWLFFTVFTIATLGLAWLFAVVTRIIIDAIILKMTDATTDRLKIDGFGWAVGAAVMISVLGSLGEYAVKAIF